MFLIAGLSPKVKKLGRFSATCPACGNKAAMMLCKKSNNVSLFFVPLIPIQSTYLATCSHCASLMEVEKEQGRDFEVDEDTVISRKHMTILQNNAGPACSGCGSLVSPGHRFCPHCGQQL